MKTKAATVFLCFLCISLSPRQVYSQAYPARCVLDTRWRDSKLCRAGIEAQRKRQMHGPVHNIHQMIRKAVDQRDDSVVLQITDDLALLFDWELVLADVRKLEVQLPITKPLHNLAKVAVVRLNDDCKQQPVESQKKPKPKEKVKYVHDQHAQVESPANSFQHVSK